MNHIGKCSLAVCLLVAGAARANEGSQQSSPAPLTPAVTVPNIPPDLKIPPELLQAATQGSTDKAPAPEPVVADRGNESAFAQPGESGEEDCEVADCGSADVATIVLPKKKNPDAIPLGKPARQAIAGSQEWAENPAALPVRDSGGRMLFPFGESIPTIVCAPLRVCDIQLQKGESVLGKPHIGDSIRWKVSHAISGSGDQQVTHLIVKPRKKGWTQI